MQQERFPKGLGRKKLDWIRREWGLKEVTESLASRATEIRSLATRNLLGTRPFLHNTSHLFLQGRDVNQPCLTEGKAEAQTKSNNHCSELQRAGFLYKALTSLCRGNKKERSRAIVTGAVYSQTALHHLPQRGASLSPPWSASLLPCSNFQDKALLTTFTRKITMKTEVIV